MSQMLTITGLTTPDRFELEDRLGPEGVSFEECDVRPGEFGELGTLIATIVVSKTALVALALFLGRGKKSGSFKETVKVTHANGSVEERTIEVVGSSVEPLQEGILKTLAGWLRLDVEELVAMIRERAK